LRGRKSKIQAASELSSAVSQFFRGAQSKIWTVLKLPNSGNECSEFAPQSLKAE
jgi:hypothetical protein